MPAALGPRFVLEAGFLILLAVVVGLADLSPAAIVLVMAVGWLLVALIEYFAWRQTAGFPTVQRYATAEAPPAPSIHQEVAEDIAPTPPSPQEEVEDVAPPPPPPPPAEEETIVAPPEAETPPADVEEPLDFKPERQITYSLEPLKPRPSRRWIIFGPRVRREGDREEER
jgi:type IV secretory pathway VirB10-like protein